MRRSDEARCAAVDEVLGESRRQFIPKPDALRIEDVRGTISDKLIVQMGAGRASVAQLVGVAGRVSSTACYLSIFGRVFQDCHSM